MTGRPMKGEGVEHEQDYIEERLEDAGDVKDYARASDQLRQEARDLKKDEGRIETDLGTRSSSTQP